MFLRVIKNHWEPLSGTPNNEQNTKIYEEEQRMKNREEQILKKKEQDEQILRIQNYNKTVYQNNMKPFLKEKEKLQTLNKEHIKTKKKEKK